jgi:hypothetical protein
MIKLALVIILLVLLVSLLMVFILIRQGVKKMKNANKDILGILKGCQNSLEKQEGRIENLLRNVQIMHSKSELSQQPAEKNDVQSSLHPAEKGNQSIQNLDKGGKYGKHNKNLDKGNNKPAQSSIIKIIFLGINSDDFFFDDEIDEQKSDTSKFVGELTSETEGTFIPIDVERIRSANVASSVKQQGMVSLKDAQSFTIIESGKICKEDQGWSIKSPVIVEFNK